MIIIDKPRLKFLLNGRTLTLTDIPTGRYRAGRAYALGTSHRKAICRVQILELSDTSMSVRLAAEQAPVRLLALYSQYGYTDNPGRAMFDEPEGLDENDLERYAKWCRARDVERRRPNGSSNGDRRLRWALKFGVVNTSDSPV